MMRRAILLVFVLFGLLSVGQVPTMAQSKPQITHVMWDSYKQKFLDPSGRIIDNGNGNISHSEGQGYGLLLAYLANNPADFEQIWTFTRTELLVRDDGLAAWRWDPEAKPHITDINNATDGDVLIAYALGLAGAAWNRADYTAAATKIAQALLSKTVIQSGGRTLLLPGVSGFSAQDRKDGPVINLSYLVYEAIPVLATLAPSEEWDNLYRDGLVLLKSATFGPRALPADWISLKGRPKPAAGFPAEFGYNALRIPLYALRAQVTDQDLLNRFRKGMKAEDGTIMTVDLSTGNMIESLKDPGYAIVPAMIDCALDQTKLPESVKTFEPTFYYSATLQLLGLAFIADKHPECL